MSAIKEVFDKADAMDRKVAKLADRVGGLARQVEERRTSVEKQALQNGASRDSARAQATKAASDLHAELVKKTDGERWGVLRELAEEEEQAKAIGRAVDSPQLLLFLDHLGSERVGRLMEQAKSLSDGALVALQRQALVDKDTEKATALVAVLDERQTTVRPFSTTELADELVGVRFKAIQRVVARITNSNQRAIVANRAFEQNRRLTGAEHIEQGLAAMAVSDE